MVEVVSFHDWPIWFLVILWVPFVSRLALFIPLRICKLESTGSCCFIFISLLNFLFCSQVIWLCFVGHRSALDSASRRNLEVLPARCGAVDGLAVAMVGLTALGFDYLRVTTPKPWLWWLLALATPPWGELLGFPHSSSTWYVIKLPSPCRICAPPSCSLVCTLFSFTWCNFVAVKNEFRDM
jgi:hypothetical protein